MEKILVQYLLGINQIFGIISDYFQILPLAKEFLLAFFDSFQYHFNVRNSLAYQADTYVRLIPMGQRPGYAINKTQALKGRANRGTAQLFGPPFQA